MLAAPISLRSNHFEATCMNPVRDITGRWLIAAGMLLAGRDGIAAPTFSSGIQTGTIQNGAVN
jgi:hypothetical protein